MCLIFFQEELGLWIWGKISPEVRGCPSHHDTSGAPNTLTGGVSVTTGGVDFAPLLRECQLSPRQVAVFPIPTLCIIFYFYLDIWAIFKVFIEFVTILFLFYILVFLARRYVGS